MTNRIPRHQTAHCLGLLVLTSVALALMGSRPSISPGSCQTSPHTTTPARHSDSRVTTATQDALLRAYGRLPLSFEANQGQTDSRVKFLARGQGYNLLLIPTEAVLLFRERDKRAVLRIKFVGANPSLHVEGVEELPGKSNYFIGNDPTKWRTNVPNYGKVRYQEIYPGVDLVYHGNEGRVEYDFVLAPGADPKSIRLQVSGAERLRIDLTGDLVAHGAGIRFQKPLIYQESNSTRKRVSGHYALTGKHVSFEVGPYDTSRTLVIDPVLTYSTYLGQQAQGSGIAADAQGNAYVTGSTSSINFPTANPFQAGLAGNGNAFVTKLNSSGTGLVYSTYLGGTGSAGGTGIAVDPAGDAYVTGNAGSGFPTTVGAFQATFRAESQLVNAFVTKLNPAGNTLVYSTYLGGSFQDHSHGIAVDSGGNAYVVGVALSSDFPITPGAVQSVLRGGADAFVAKLNSSGTALLYSTLLGGSEGERGLGISLDSSGNAYVTGFTLSTDFPTTSGALQTRLASAGKTDAFVAKLNPQGQALVYSSYLGGSGADLANGIAVDSGGNAYVVGQTFSTDFPITPGAVQNALRGPGDAFVAKLNSSGTALRYSTFLGGSSGNAASAIALDSTGNAYVTGSTSSVNFPTTPGAFQTAYGGGSGDGFMTKLNTTGTALVYSTLLGGRAADVPASVAVDTVGNVYVTGSTSSTNFPTTPGSFQPIGSGAFIVRLSTTKHPKVNPGGLVNGASFSTEMAAGSVASIFGANLAAATASAASVPLPSPDNSRFRRHEKPPVL